jgi:pimeloyl-ACP methyl ester carboxylesterase
MLAAIVLFDRSAALDAVGPYAAAPHPVPSRHLAEAARSIPGCSVVTIPAGHRVPRRRPGQFLAEVVPFLASRTAKGA